MEPTSELRQEFIDAIEIIEDEGSCIFQYGYVVDEEVHIVVQHNEEDLYIDLCWMDNEDELLSTSTRTEEQEAKYRERLASLNTEIFTYDDLIHGLSD